MSIEKIDNVILVNEQDEAIGTMEKMEAHRKGFLHRAFSVFVFNNRGELLIQRRANEKYHSGGLWTNTCCSHPRSDENTEVTEWNDGVHGGRRDRAGDTAGSSIVGAAAP